MAEKKREVRIRWANMLKEMRNRRPDLKQKLSEIETASIEVFEMALECGDVTINTVVEQMHCFAIVNVRLAASALLLKASQDAIKGVRTKRARQR